MTTIISVQGEEPDQILGPNRDLRTKQDFKLVKIRYVKSNM